MSKYGFLVEKLPNGEIKRWSLDNDEIMIGRKSPAEILLPYSRVSRQHAKITSSPKGYFIQDLGSRNCTYVNGGQVEAE
ncbi:MAG: FHA domain-containing protein, partial [Anaerolineales bacterium]